MKYNDKNKPLVCMMTESTCYKGTRKFTPKGVLWHSTGANNPWLKRYVQPDDNAANRSELLNLLGKNQYRNDWNHIEREAGLNFWIGKLADGTVAAVQTMPWDYRPWGCGSGNNGSCNNTHIQFEICEDGLNDKSYWEAVYKEACEMTAYLCKMFGIDPKGTTTCNGVTVPTIIDHTGSHALGLGSNHGDVQHWSRKYGKTMENVRNDVAALLAGDDPAVSTSVADSNLTKGSAGEAVRTMQTMLIACGYSCGATGADGDFGNNTLAALKAFQKDSGLAVDGIYGPATKADLEKAFASHDTSPVSQSTIAINAEQAIWEFFMERSTDLLVNILGIIAEEESRSIGENVRLGLQVRCATGHPVGRVAYGYRRINKDADWAIEEEEAKRIRLMFRMAAAGECYQDIRKALDQMEAEAGTGITWNKERLRRTLNNVVYKGDVQTGKTYTVYEKKKKVKKNRGERESYMLEGHHEPIVTPELFDRVQSLMGLGLLHSYRSRMTTQERTLLRDESWRAAQDRLERKQIGKPIVVKGGYRNGDE